MLQFWFFHASSLEQEVLRAQCVEKRTLDTGNPTPGNIGSDFDRFQVGFWPTVLALDSRHESRRNNLGALNNWRNAIAHHHYNPARLGQPMILSVQQVTDWRTDCDALATAFDTVARDLLQSTTGAAPWPS